MKLIPFVAAAAVVGSVALAAPAQASVFAVCPSGVAGIITNVTSCPFADNARATWYAEGGPTYLSIYSPVTGQSYAMTCTANQVVTLGYGQRVGVLCVGGNDAELVFW